jgi:hypothetical protein
VAGLGTGARARRRRQRRGQRRRGRWRHGRRRSGRCDGVCGCARQRACGAHREPSRDNQRREHAASRLGMRCLSARRSTWDGAPRRPPARDESSTGEDRCEHASPCSRRLGVAACSDRSKAGRRAETGENEDEAQDPVARRRTWSLPAAVRLPESTSCIIRIDFRHRTRYRNAQQALLHGPAFLRACVSRSRFLRARIENRATLPSADAVSRWDHHLASRAGQSWTPSQGSACSRRHQSRTEWRKLCHLVARQPPRFAIWTASTRT